MNDGGVSGEWPVFLYQVECLSVVFWGGNGRKWRRWRSVTTIGCGEMTRSIGCFKGLSNTKPGLGPLSVRRVHRLAIKE